LLSRMMNRSSSRVCPFIDDVAALLLIACIAEQADAAAALPETIDAVDDRWPTGAARTYDPSSSLGWLFICPGSSLPTFLSALLPSVCLRPLHNDFSVVYAPRRAERGVTGGIESSTSLVTIELSSASAQPGRCIVRSLSV